MVPNAHPLAVEEEKVAAVTAPPLSHVCGSVTRQMQFFYASRAETMKSKADQFAAEIQQKQDKMKLINQIIAEINHCTDEQNGLDISKNSELIEKLQLAGELGVKIKEGKKVFSGIEKDRLIENLHLANDCWDKENRLHTQKLEIILKELDRVMMLLKDAQRKEDQAIRPILANVNIK